MRTGTSGGSAERDRGLAARRRYYDALVRQVTTRGFEGATVAGVIAGAGSSKGAFYHHFRDKWHLLERWYAEHTQGSVRRTNAAVTTGASVEQALTEEVLRVARDFSGGRGLMIPTVLRFMVFAMQQPRFSKLIADNYAPKIALSRQLVAQGVRTGEFRPGTDAEAFSEVLTAGLFGVYLFHYSCDADGDLIAKVRRYLRLQFDAIRSSG